MIQFTALLEMRSKNKLSISLVDAVFLLWFFVDKHLKMIKMLSTFHFLQAIIIESGSA